MAEPQFFFGFGSLVNVATHTHRPCQPATLHGWRRIWRHLPVHGMATLSVEPAPGSQIQGLIAQVAPGGWAALDQREASYERQAVEVTLTETGQTETSELYVVPGGVEAETRPILRSYLDVVVQGYGQVFGPEGVADFFASTSGWEAGIADDRAAPLYPRHQTLSDFETALVVRHIEAFPRHQ